MFIKYLLVILRSSTQTLLSSDAYIYPTIPRLEFLSTFSSSLVYSLSAFVESQTAFQLGQVYPSDLCCRHSFANTQTVAMSSSLYHPRPVLSSQRYTPSPDYLQDARRTYHNNSRLPLRETASNAQSHNFNSMVPCYSSPVGISPSVPASLPAPMIPSQSFECLYRVPTPRNQPRFQQRRPRNGVNPLYFWPAFRQYRNRQAHKDTQKDKGGVWRRPELEDAFVDCEYMTASLSDLTNPNDNQPFFSCLTWDVASSPWEESYMGATCLLANTSSQSVLPFLAAKKFSESTTATTALSRWDASRSQVICK